MISTHILDTSLGKPAAGVSVLLEHKATSKWSSVSQEKTDKDGRISFPKNEGQGTYRLTFMTEDYFKTLKQEHFFRDVEITFNISDLKRKYHVPLLLNPFGYSTYRGS